MKTIYVYVYVFYAESPFAAIIIRVQHWHDVKYVGFRAIQTDIQTHTQRERDRMM